MRAGQTYQFTESQELIRLVEVTSETVYYMNLFEKNRWFPDSMSFNEFIAKLRNNKIERAADPYAGGIELGQLSNKGLEKALHNWEWIEELWSSHKEELLSQKRSRAVNDFAKEKGCSVNTVKNLLNQFFRRGMSLSALAPQYNQCGKARLSRELKQKTEAADSASSPTSQL